MARQPRAYRVAFILPGHTVPAYRSHRILALSEHAAFMAALHRFWGRAAKHHIVGPVTHPGHAPQRFYAVARARRGTYRTATMAVHVERVAS